MLEEISRQKQIIKDKEEKRKRARDIKRDLHLQKKTKAHSKIKKKPMRAAQEVKDI